MSKLTIEGQSRIGGKTQAMITHLDNLLKIKALAIVPCVDGSHARLLRELITRRGLRVNLCARLNKGIQRMPHTSRRSIFLEVTR